jgi:hypothetical protein
LLAPQVQLHGAQEFELSLRAFVSLNHHSIVRMLGHKR